MSRFLSVLLALLLFAPVTGELWRLPVFGFELLPSDLLIPVFFTVWALDKWRNDPKLRLGRIGRVIVFFLFVLVFTWALNLFRFPLSEMLVAGSYLGRFGMYVILEIIAFDLFTRDAAGRMRTLVLAGMIGSMAILALLGFLQLRFFPSFLALGLDLQGWDPHIGRLLSTWFDPNFVGGYLAFTLGPVLALALYFRRAQKRPAFLFFAAMGVIGFLALYYTFSRSGYLAGATMVGLLAFFKSRKLLMAAFLLAFLGFLFSPRMQERVGDGLESARALVGVSSQTALDPTAELRVRSWQEALDIIADHPIIGAGFGRYAYEINRRGYGLLSDHDSGGSDSSLLTLWAMSGAAGLAAYLAVGFVAGVLAVRRLWRRNDFQAYLSAGLLSAFAGVMVHAAFVNSLLFPLMMVYLWPALALLDEA